ncbi:cysteine-rich small domain-containing protein [Guggenheimella bovis]
MEHYKKFTNKECEYFPCHKGVAEEDFNCLFCYCPLFLLGTECGGDFSLHDGIKDCSGCTRPHRKDSYSFVMSKMPIIFNRRFEK